MANQSTYTFSDIEQFATDPINSNILITLLQDGKIDEIKVGGMIYRQNSAPSLIALIYKNKR